MLSSLKLLVTIVMMVFIILILFLLKHLSDVPLLSRRPEEIAPVVVKTEHNATERPVSKFLLYISKTMFVGTKF